MRTGSPDEDWRVRGNCSPSRGIDPKLWDEDIPGEEEPDRDERHRVAAAECAECPVLAQCKAFAEASPTISGVLGGELRIARRYKDLPADSPKHGTYSAYANNRCRCDPCSAVAHARGVAARAARRQPPIDLHEVEWVLRTGGTRAGISERIGSWEAILLACARAGRHDLARRLRDLPTNRELGLEGVA